LFNEHTAAFDHVDGELTLRGLAIVARQASAA